MISLMRTIVQDPWPILDVALYILALIALTWGGNWVCRWVLELSGISLPTATAPHVPSAPPAAPSPPNALAPPMAATSPRAGRMIGSLERLIILLGLAAGSWEIIAAVIALKTVGRFKELDDRLQAEYFLIGSLASIVWAALISLIFLRFDSTWGFYIAELLKSPKAG